jgi:diguanylate cyclase (GGDEF)-like protein/PAS domain S-box-containing protein
VERHGSTTRWGSRDAVMVGTRMLAVLYLLFVPAKLLLLDGTASILLATLAGATAIFFVAAARTALTVGDRTVDRMLVAVCLLPLVNALVQLALVHNVTHSTVVLLVVVGIGAVAGGRRTAWVLVTTSCLGWLLTVAVTRPQPASEVPFFALQLALACLLSLAVLEIRLSAYRRLTRARDRNEMGLRRFRSVFDDSPVGIALADERGRFVEANAALCELLGRPVRELLGRSSAEFTHPEDPSLHADVGRLIETAPNGVARLEKRYVRPDGSVRWGGLTITHVGGPNGETWTLAHVQDVTQRHEAEEELRLSRESMVAAVEIAQATQGGRDPRPVVLHHLKRLAGASFVSMIEPLGDDRLAVTAVDGGIDLVGLSMALDEPSVTTHVWNSGESVFASQLAEHPLVSGRLIESSGAESLMWQPVGTPGDTLAVLSIAWDDPLPGVDTAGRAAVEAVAAEAGAALTGEQMRRSLERSTVTDSLTGLLNRRGWDAEVAKLCHHTERTGVPFTLALVDLDHFKRYNDTFGHLAGDDALRTFAANAEGTLRVVDVIARWGGEEFAVALHGTTAAEALGAVERLRASVPEGLSCSVGYVEVGPGADLQESLSCADEALYRAKSAGRDRAVLGALPRREQHRD